MGTPKALLTTPEGRPFIARIVRSLLVAGVLDVVIVTGTDHDAIVEAMGRDAPPVMPRFARNPDPARGQLSSLWVGMDASVGPATEGLLMTLADVPMLDPATIGAVIDAWRRTHAPIVRPAIGDRHGHPVIFDRSVFADLRGAPMDKGAKAVVQAREAEVMNVIVADEGCLVDIDTRTDYEALRRGKV